MGNEPSIRVIHDDVMKNLSLKEIIKLRGDKDVIFNITNIQLIYAYQHNDVDKMTFLKYNFGLTKIENYCVDMSLESGDEQMVRFLIEEFNCRPSRYALKIAAFNGYKELVEWIDLK